VNVGAVRLLHFAIEHDRDVVVTALRAHLHAPQTIPHLATVASVRHEA